MKSKSLKFLLSCLSWGLFSSILTLVMFDFIFDSIPIYYIRGYHLNEILMPFLISSGSLILMFKRKSDRYWKLVLTGLITGVFMVLSYPVLAPVFSDYFGPRATPIVSLELMIVFLLIITILSVLTAFLFRYIARKKNVSSDVIDN